MRRRAIGWAGPVIVAVALVLTGAGCASQSTAGGTGDALDGATLVQQRCTRCHPSDRIDTAKHDRVAWQATVDRMRGKGAQLSDPEAATVVEYLSTR